MPNKKIKILGQVILPGETHQLSLNIAKLHTGSTIEVPVIVSRGKEAGPTLLLTGGIHGNEINGVEIVRKIISEQYHIPVAGMVICIPVVNVFGFLSQTREFPDGRDLNRVFPGSLRGSLASRFAYHIVKEIIPNIDYCIDFHTGGDSRFNAPQIRIGKNDAESLALAKTFGTRFIITSAKREKSFRETLNKLNKKVLLFEGGKSLNINNEVSKVGLTGALRVMQQLGIRNFQKEIASLKSTKETTYLVEDSAWIRAKFSGLFHPTVQLGQYVNIGDNLGSLSDPFGYFEKKQKATFAGHVICVNQSPIVNQGDAIVHITKSEVKLD
ncbi:Succinylglutamate desuccinylase/aspartoacylase [Cellulophaga algicola DSM 14237]|uniref:Succinylglutamate desuccinylase/aspartoacylase n=1 Tax=Cellulophaga algicola (strain DSM 14237 / IC166 / ACAM 630) TaxID=688270 RepID=E6X572_CELAD|nr:succinylglutamate desuccinylase/aspartoacylase family protein [Cellulophaga algicola]ADV49408.1 Succinylglutamate desuccinylase/aspartoacylase [Cellulophaga algicola DSM 14237]